MRKENFVIYERELMHTIGGQLYYQAPNRAPRNVGIIMDKVKEAFRKDAHNSNEWYSLRVEDIKTYVHDLLFAIPEFEELNLTQVEYENGIKVNDPNRPKYSFCSAYDVNTEDSWKNDFIDLDAFVGNVVRTLKETSHDCFGCEYENSHSSKCLYCKWHTGLENNFVADRRPKGEYTLSCNHDCKNNYYICCSECNKKGKCEYECDSTPDMCNNLRHDWRCKGIECVQPKEDM